MFGQLPYSPSRRDVAADHALVRYKNEALMPMVYDALVDVLINHKGYPAAVLSQPYDADFWYGVWPMQSRPAATPNDAALTPPI